jgi:LuxR family maltose regulon positive regulatory protein
VHGCSATRANGARRTGQLEAAFGYAQKAGDVDRAAKLFEMCGPLVYQSGRIATTERWLGWLEAHGAMERNAAVAALGAAVASTWGRPAEALRLADVFERASYDGSLPDGSASVDSWRALVRAQLCRRGVAQMRAMRSTRSGRSPRGASTGRTPRCSSPSRSGWRARTTRPTTCSPTSPRRA